MNPAQKYLTVIGLVSVLLLACGCVSTLSVVTVPAAAVNLGTMAYQSIEDARILIRVHEGLTKESLREIRNVAVFMGKESRVKPYGRIGDIEAVVGDNLAMQLTREGFCIYDADDIQRVEKRPQIETDYQRGEMLRTCQALGAQAMISGHVVAGRAGFGILGIGRENTVVHSVSLSMTEVKTIRTLMTIDVEYRLGQRPHVAAEGLAMIIKAKLNDPGSDIKALFRKKQDTNPNTRTGDFGKAEAPLLFSDSLQ